MMRVYRLSKIGAKLPRKHSYGPATSPDACQSGFEAFKGPIFSIANSIGPASGSLGEGDFTAAAGYDLMLLIDVRNLRGHAWNPFTWVVISPSDVEAVRVLAVADLHAWLCQQPACVGPDGQLCRKAVEEWVKANKVLVESWLDQHSQNQLVEFEETIGGSQGAE
jgi:hypothetical protein